MYSVQLHVCDSYTYIWNVVFSEEKPRDLFTCCALHFGPSAVFNPFHIFVPAAQVVPDCCKDKSPMMFPLQRIESYSIQEAGSGCDISATVWVSDIEKVNRSGESSVVSSLISFLFLQPQDKDWEKTVRFTPQRQRLGEETHWSSGKEKNETTKELGTWLKMSVFLFALKKCNKNLLYPFFFICRGWTFALHFPFCRSWPLTVRDLQNCQVTVESDVH